MAIVRLEQLYPFPFKQLGKQLTRYRNADVIWCQEEPENMGSWHFADRRIEKVLGEADSKYTRPRYVGRSESAATATGLLNRHLKEQAQIIHEALRV